MNGKEIQVLYEMKGEFSGMKDAFEKMSEQVGKLPCTSQTERLKALEAWKKSVAITSAENLKGKYSIIVAVISLIGVFILAIIQVIT